MSKLIESKFQRVPEGWAFDASPLAFGSGYLYLVTDAQKTALIARIRRYQWIAPGVIFGALISFVTSIVGLPSIWDRSSADLPIMLQYVTLLVFGGVVFACLLGGWHLAIRPVVTGARQLERISFAERFRRQAKAWSLTTLIMVVVLFLVSSGYWAYQAFGPVVRGPGVSPLLIAALFASVASFYFGLLVMKLRAKK